MRPRMRSLVSAVAAALVLAAALPAASVSASGPGSGSGSAFTSDPTTPPPDPAAPTSSSPAAAGGQGGAGTNTPRPGFASVGIQMVTADGKPAVQTRYTYEGTPGARFPNDAFAVVNYGNQPLAVHVYANDAMNTASGGFDLKTAGTAPTDIGGWLHLDLKTPYVTVPPAGAAGAPGRVLVAFHLQVPAQATPGDHVGGIVAGVVSPSTDKNGNRINVEQRVGLRVYLRVPGTLRAQMAVTKVSAVYHGTWNPFGTGSATVTYTVKNTGNVRLDAAQVLRVTSLFGSAQWKSTPPAQGVLGTDISELLPGQTVTLTQALSGIVPSFSSTARVSVDPRAMSGDLDPQAVGDASAASMATVPWPWVVIVLLILLVVAWRLGLRSRWLWRRGGGAGTGFGFGFGFGVSRGRKPMTYPSAPAAERDADEAEEDAESESVSAEPPEAAAAPTADEPPTGQPGRVPAEASLEAAP